MRISVKSRGCNGADRNRRPKCLNGLNLSFCSIHSLNLHVSVCSAFNGDFFRETYSKNRKIWGKFGTFEKQTAYKWLDCIGWDTLLTSSNKRIVILRVSLEGLETERSGPEWKRDILQDFYGFRALSARPLSYGVSLRRRHEQQFSEPANPVTSLLPKSVSFFVFAPRCPRYPHG